jgi:hypothetical protein
MKTGFTTFEISKALGVKYGRLRGWLDVDAIPISVQQADGPGTKRLFTFFDVCMIGLFRELLERGFSREDASTASDAVGKYFSSLGGKRTLERDGVFYFDQEKAVKLIFFFIDGGQLIKVRPSEKVAFKSINAALFDSRDQAFQVALVSNEMLSQKTFLQIISYDGFKTNPCAFDSIAVVNFKRIVQKISGALL